MTVEQFSHLLLGSSPVEGVCNSYVQWDPLLDIGPEAPAQRVQHLQSYLTSRIGIAEVIFIAEAPGFQGARFSGIAMTCERTLLGAKPGIPADQVYPEGFIKSRTSLPLAGRGQTQIKNGYCEPTATHVWSELVKRPGAAQKVILWNTFPFHPYMPGNPLSNRKPSPTEVMSKIDIVQAMLELFPGVRIVAVGGVAHENLKRIGLDVTAGRHPSYGGAPEFKATVRAIFDEMGLPAISPFPAHLPQLSLDLGAPA